MEMLQYTKVILLKVSFDKGLFEKELRKGINLLEVKELLQLKQWCFEVFQNAHLLILIKVFSNSKEPA